jgi:hypothetical protein
MTCEHCHGDGWRRVGNVTITVQVCPDCYGQGRCPRCGETVTKTPGFASHACACGWQGGAGWWNAAMRKESDE